MRERQSQRNPRPDAPVGKAALSRYLHGWSASRQEISPCCEQLAAKLQVTALSGNPEKLQATRFSDTSKLFSVLAIDREDGVRV